MRGRPVDTTGHRMQRRRRRLWQVVVGLGVPLGYGWARELAGNPVHLGVPAFVRANPEWLLPTALLAVLTAAALIAVASAGRSPHTVLRPRDSSVRLSEVVGATAATGEVADVLHLFLHHETFRDEMGGSARRGVLFEGPSGTGKTYVGKAMAAEADVPLLFVSASEFHSMFHGQTNRKVRAYFRALRRTARAKGGAIGFIEELDAIGAARTGAGHARESGVVNELLVQMQSFDVPTVWHRLRSDLVELCNRRLPERHRLAVPVAEPANVLLVAATSRAADLDPALFSPGRFDRVIHFDLPPRTDRMSIAEHFLARKRHDQTVSAAFVGDLTAGYTPAGIERLLDEALVVALHAGSTAMSYQDVIAAQMVGEVGVAHDVGFHPEEKRRIATHEAGHALQAALAGRDVKLASVLRRSGTLGMVAHGDVDERFLRTPSEARDLMSIALAGRAAEIQEFGEASSGIADDLATATDIAAQLVGMLGAGDSLLSLQAAHIPGADNLVAKVLHDPQARSKADELLHAAADRSACTVLEHRRALLALSDALCEFDELTGDEVHAIVAGAMVN
ncbi:MAG: AAA family ATPase [Ilumatobacteraceae bacterium]